jgi:hypothetical protein
VGKARKLPVLGGFKTCFHRLFQLIILQRLPKTPDMFSELPSLNEVSSHHVSVRYGYCAKAPNCFMDPSISC